VRRDAFVRPQADRAAKSRAADMIRDIMDFILLPPILRFGDSMPGEQQNFHSVNFCIKSTRRKPAPGVFPISFR
jgi:hypothetical protein